MLNLAIFASGNGSNFQAIAEYFNKYPSSPVKLLVCDRSQAHVIRRAEDLGIPHVVIERKDYPSKELFELAILQHLEQANIHFIALAGYMRLIGATILKQYPGKIVNIHPSLLPAFPGKHAVCQAISYGVKISGVTIHFVDEGMDTGPIIYQKSVPVYPTDTAVSLQARINAIELDIFPQVIEKCLSGQILLNETSVEAWEELIICES